MAVAISWLARRDHTSGELQARLERKGFEPDAAAAAIAQLLEDRLLNDARYAANYVMSHAGRGQGPVRIAADLGQLGLPEALIHTALAEGGDWAVRAREVRSRKFGPQVPCDWPEKARQARFLQYRGFSSDHIRLALGNDFDPDG